VAVTTLKTLSSSRIDGSMIGPGAQAVSHDEAQERARRGTRQFLLARLCVVASGYVATAILTRKLGPTDYGIYGVVMSQLLWLEMLTNAGVSGAIAKLMAESRHDHGEIECSAQTLLLSFSVLLFGVCWFLAPHVARVMQIPNGEVLFRIAIIDLPFAAIFVAYDGILNGRRHFGVLAMAYVVYGLAKLAGVLALIAIGFSTERVLVTFVISTCMVSSALLVLYRPRGRRPRGPIMGRIAVITAPLALYLVAGQVLLNLDLWSLKGLLQGGGEVVGYYVASMNLAKILMVIPGAQAGVIFTSVAWAVASRDTARAQRHIQDATRFAVILAAAALVILGLNASEVLSLLYSPAYAAGEHFLPLQLAGFGLFALLDAFSQALIAAGRRGFVVGGVVVTVPIVWLSNYILIPRIGPLGAATSMLLGLTIATALIGMMAYRHFGSVVQASTLLRVLCAVAVVGLASIASPVAGPLVLVKLAVLGGIYLLVLYMLGEITGKDFGLSGKIPDDRSV
jgi:O-antigen/teichoic acid export membrane protein